ncbi:MAG: hypothetical protein COZ57_02890, partial [Armatimonadetes bacterium CG_4_8_14_3_um_filter_66_20]
VGGEVDAEVFEYRLTVSIHAPGWGARIDAETFKLIHAVSIHAPGWGASAGSAGPDFSGTCGTLCADH